MLSAPPSEESSVPPTEATLFLQMLGVTLPDEANDLQFVALLASSALKPIFTGQSDSQEKPQSWNQTRNGSSLHPHLDILNMVINSYRLFIEEPFRLAETLAISRDSLVISAKNWRHDLKTNLFYHQDTLQLRSDDPADEYRAKLDLFDALASELLMRSLSKQDTVVTEDYSPSALSAILAAQESQPPNEANLLRLLRIQEIWRDTCPGKFPCNVLKWMAPKQSLGIFSNSDLKIAPQPSPILEIANFSEIIKETPKKETRCFNLGDRASLETLDPAVRLETVEFITAHFDQNLPAAFRALSKNLPVITKANFLSYFQHHASPFKPAVMFAALDREGLGELRKEDLVLADDESIAVAQMVLKAVSEEMIEALSRQIIITRISPGSRPRTSEHVRK